VPYKGVNLAMNGVLAGEVHLVFIGVPVPAPHIKAGRLRGLAVLGRERSPLIPDVPTAAEAGLADFDVTTWYGILAPAGTPRPIIQRLNAELTKMMQAPEIRERLAAMGTDPLTSTPEELGAYIKQEMARWGDVIRKANLHAE
jgi:tripartite-type tricarboxylate transporter receptor subunit TctC